MKTVVIPLDGSALAEQAIPYARQLASLLRASVTLVRVVAPDEIQTVLARIAVAPERPQHLDTELAREHYAIDELTRRTAAYLADQAQLLRDVGLSVAARTAVGPAAEEIVGIARSETDAVLVMATHGYSGLQRWALGSTADRVVHIATMPVLLVRVGARPPEQQFALRRILVPLDGSALAEQALPPAVELASHAHAELILLRVNAYPVELGPEFIPVGLPLSSVSQQLEAERTVATQYLAAAIAQIDHRELLISPSVVTGHFAEEIVRQAAECHADLIVMATHGRSGLRRWMLGSVADKVMHATHVPLMLVRTRDADSPWQ